MSTPDWPLIRVSQLRAMGQAARETFTERLAQHVATVFPLHADYLQQPAGRRFLGRCIDAALGHGLKDQHSTALYTDLVVALGERFEAQPRYRWLLDLLADRSLPAPARLCLIYDQLPERCPGPPLPPPEGDEELPASALTPAVPLWSPGNWG